MTWQCTPLTFHASKLVVVGWEVVSFISERVVVLDGELVSYIPNSIEYTQHSVEGLPATVINVITVSIVITMITVTQPLNRGECSHCWRMGPLVLPTTITQTQR